MKGWRVLAWILLIAGMMTGCVSQLVKRGDMYGAQGRWLDAVESYARANEVRPNNTEVAAKLRAAREEAVKQELIKAERALIDGQLPSAWSHVEMAAKVLHQDIRVAEMRGRIREAAVEGIRTDLVRLDFEKAYIDLGTLKRHDPGHEIIAQLSDELADAIVDQSYELVSRTRYGQARDLLIMLGKNQPEYAREVEIRVEELEHRWVVGLRTQAAWDERKKRLASAWIRRAMAAGISEDRQDHLERDRVRQLFLRRHGVVVASRVSGDQRRTSRLYRSLDRSLSHHGVIRWTPGVRNADLGGRVLLKPPMCSNSHADRSAAKQYVVGTKQVPNPKWVRHEEKLADALVGLDRTQQRVSHLRRRLEEIANATAQVNDRVTRMTVGLDAAKARLADLQVAEARATDRLEASSEAAGAVRTMEMDRAAAKKSVEDGRKAVKQAEKELQTAQQPTLAPGGESQQRPVGDPPNVVRVEQAREKLATAKAKLKAAVAHLESLPKPTNEQRVLAQQMDERRMAVENARKRVASARQALEEVRAKLTRAREERQTLENENRVTQREFGAAREKLAETRTTVGRLQHERQTIPRTVTEEIRDTFHYTIQDWTRRCLMTADMSDIRPRQTDMRMELAVGVETKDTSHPRYRAYGVTADPLVFPMTDRQLYDEGDAQLFSEVREWFRRALNGVRLTRLERGRQLEQRDLEGAITQLLIAWMMAPREQPAELSDLLPRHYGAIELGWLGIRER